MYQLPLPHPRTLLALLKYPLHILRLHELPFLIPDTPINRVLEHTSRQPGYLGEQPHLVPLFHRVFHLDLEVRYKLNRFCPASDKLACTFDRWVVIMVCCHRLVEVCGAFREILLIAPI